MWLCGCVKSCQGEGESSEVGGGDCVSRGCSAAYRGGGRGQVGRYYILLHNIYYRALLPAAHFGLVGGFEQLLGSRC